MKKLIIDIENTPNTVHRWGMFDKSPVSPVQLIEPMRLMCFAYQWKGRSTIFRSPQNTGGHREMVEVAHGLLAEADVVVTYNGKRHDIPILNREFALLKLNQPAPYYHSDLYPVVRRLFKFPFGKLDYVCRELGIGGKVSHGGHSLWIRCMQGDPKALAEMARYNRQDVKLLAALDDYLASWTPTPNARLFIEGDDVCPRCGATGKLHKEGHRYTAQGKYQRFACSACGGWSTETRRISGTEIKGMS